MTKLMKAEELLERLARLTDEDTSEGAIIFGDPVSQEDRRQSCLTEIRAFQRNTLEVAAKAVCPQCQIAVPRDYEAHRGVVHIAKGRTWVCLAHDIWKLYAQLNPARAGNENQTGEQDGPASLLHPQRGA